MIQDFANNINKIKNISLEEKKNREKNLKLFNEKGFPSKRLEEWKFTDLDKIINKNFKDLKSNIPLHNNHKINLIKDFEHNSIILINGVLKSSDFKYEDKNKIKISEFREILKEEKKK